MTIEYVIDFVTQLLKTKWLPMQRKPQSTTTDKLQAVHATACCKRNQCCGHSSQKTLLLPLLRS
jgi:hypothetical protein